MLSYHSDYKQDLSYNEVHCILDQSLKDQEKLHIRTHNFQVLPIFQYIFLCLLSYQLQLHTNRTNRFHMNNHHSRPRWLVLKVYIKTNKAKFKVFHSKESHCNLNDVNNKNLCNFQHNICCYHLLNQSRYSKCLHITCFHHILFHYLSHKISNHSKCILHSYVCLKLQIHKMFQCLDS